MNTIHDIPSRSEKGSVTILAAFSMLALLGFGALVLDLGAMMVTQVELQNSADSAVLAANRELATVYREMGPSLDLQNHELSESERARVLAKASRYASSNKAHTRAVEILPDDLVLGVYDPATGYVREQSRGARAVGLKTRRDDEINGAMPTVLAGVLGVDSLPVRATAAAGLSPLASIPAGASTIPVGISSHWFESQQCGPGSTIRFYPTGSLESCSGWHTYTDRPASASRLGSILDGLRTGSYQSPPATAGKTFFEFTGGTVASRFPAMQALYDSKKDGDGKWSVIIPVYQDSSCANPTGSLRIVGFATAHIYEVTSAPEKTITANVDCAITDIGQAGGEGDYGTLVGRPGLLH